jgi:hypothetical protein
LIPKFFSFFSIKMGSEVKDYKLDEKVWKTITLDSRQFAIAEVTKALLKDLFVAHVIHCVYGRYVLLETGWKCGLEYTGNPHNALGTIVSFGINADEIAHVILRLEIQRALVTQVHGPTKEEEAVSKVKADFDAMVSKWKDLAHLDDQSSSVSFPFKKEILLHLLKSEMKFQCEDSLTITAWPVKSPRSHLVVEGPVSWRVCEDYKATGDISSVIVTLKNNFDIIYERVYCVIFVYTASKTDMLKLHRFYSVVQENRHFIDRYLKEESTRSLSAVRNGDNFLTKTNFYDAVREQMKDNPSQSVFYFKKTGRSSDNFDFECAIDGHDQWTRKWMPGGYACFLKNGNANAGFERAMAIAVAISMILLTVVAYAFFIATLGNNGIPEWFAVNTSVFIISLVMDVFLGMGYLLFMERRAKQLTVWHYD